jgi:hypothetical protein
VGGRSRFSLSVLLATSLLPTVSFGEPARPIRILGSASLSATVSAPTSGEPAVEEVRVEGRLEDDANQGVPDAHVLLTLGTGAPSPLLQNCPGHTSLQRGEGDVPQLKTDAEGRFCLILPASTLPGARLTYTDAAGYLGAAELKLPSTPAMRSLELSFGAVPTELSLDTPIQGIEVSSALPPGGTPMTGETQLDLGLLTPHGAFGVIASTFVHPGERARFEVPSAAFGAPGTAVLVARVAGTALDGTEARQRITKTASVSLLPSSLSLEVREGETFELPVNVRWARGDVDSGTVEARADGRAVAAAPVQKGSAKLVIPGSWSGGTSAVAPDQPRTIELHFVPSSPWWKPGPPAVVPVSFQPPSNWSHLPWLVGALALFGWVALIWKRPPRRARSLTPVAIEPPGRESLSVEDASDGALRGQVLDAHSSEPVLGATVRVTESGIERELELANVPCDAEGRFDLSLAASLAPRRLHVQAAGYAEMIRPLPQRGRLVVHLVTVRRSVLEQLNAWARRKGSPWYQGGSPTPAEISETARSRSDGRVERWANDVEMAAFGPDEPSTQTERSLREGEPP